MNPRSSIGSPRIMTSHGTVTLKIHRRITRAGFLGILIATILPAAPGLAAGVVLGAPGQIASPSGPGVMPDLQSDAVLPDLGQQTKLSSGKVVIRDVPPGENPFVSAPVSTPAGAGADGSAPLATAPSIEGAAALAETVPFHLAQPAAPGSEEQKNTASRPDPRPVDENALRYYASQQDFKRLAAELRRIRALNPGWEPPETLFDPASSVSEKPLWDMFKVGNLVGLQAEIARIQQANPSWKPSRKLLSEVKIGEARLVLQRAYRDKKWGELLSVAETTPDLMTCPNMGALWSVGEALARTEDYARAFDLYKFILTNCQSPADRLATVQKAEALIPEAGFRSLLALGKTMSDGSGEFEAVSFDPLRRALGDTAAGHPDRKPIAQADLEDFAAFIQRKSTAEDASLLGWYYYALNAPEVARAWFTYASRLSSDPKNIEGIVLCLRKIGDRPQAFTFARQNASLSLDIKRQYVELYAEALADPIAGIDTASDLPGFEKALLEVKSAVGAEALGWLKLEKKEARTARDFFAKAASWDLREGSVIGLAVVAARQKDRAALSELKANYEQRFPALEKFKLGSHRKQTKKNPLKVVKKKPATLLGSLFNKNDG